MSRKSTHSIIILSVIVFVFLYPTLIECQWTQQTNGLPEDFTDAGAIDACDSNTAIITFSSISGSRIFQTIDGGQYWQEVPLEDGIWITDICMIDDNHIWICSYSPAKIYYTSDGGSNWSEQFYDTTLTNFFNYIEMFDQNNGIAMGDAIESGPGPALILKTSDGGINWISVNDSAFGGSSGDIWRKIDFINTEEGYFFEAGIAPNYLYKTTNGCSTWVRTNHPENRLHVLKFFNESIGLSANWEGVNQTLDGGVTWESISIPNIGWGMDLEFDPDNPANVWLVGINNVFFSNDTGRTWSIQFSASIVFRDIVFIDGRHGWLLGDGGLFHTTDGGLMVFGEDFPNNPEIFMLSQNYPNPFNPITTIEYSLPRENHVKLTIYDVSGRHVKTLVNSREGPGYKSIKWDGSNEFGQSVGAGIYIYTIKAGEYVKTRKMVLLK
ncbi:MAG: T9SS type A sorting domain-containing protein [FCB group bacterium]|nr:T9SS type A sorting domain-containing protein [FCB group bacterium]